MPAVTTSTPNPPSDGEIRDFVGLGEPKGSLDDEQHQISGSIDFVRANTAAVWRIPSTARLAQAAQ